MVNSTGAGGAGPVVEAVVSLVRVTGSDDLVSLALPAPVDEAWRRSRPGQLVAFPGDPARAQVLPSVHWLADRTVDPLHGTAVDLVLAPGHGLVPGAVVRLIGPLGRGFGLPAERVPVLLVGHERAAVPLRWLAALLRDRGCPVHVILSATDPDAHPDLSAIRRHATSLVLTDPGGVEEAVRRRLGDAGVEPGSAPAVVFATGPRAVVSAIARLALDRGLAVRVTALDPDEGIVCGTGLCGQCDLVGGDHGVLRACLDGPAVPGEWVVDATW